MPKPKPKKCMSPGCKRTDLTGFGNCHTHYYKHKRKVDLGRDTWEAIIDRGEAIPSKSMIAAQERQRVGR